jgi:hypothetical protein
MTIIGTWHAQRGLTPPRVFRVGAEGVTRRTDGARYDDTYASPTAGYSAPRFSAADSRHRSTSPVPAALQRKHQTTPKQRI